MAAVELPPDPAADVVSPSHLPPCSLPQQALAVLQSRCSLAADRSVTCSVKVRRIMHPLRRFS